MQQAASTILMVRPASFGFNAETAANNVFQSADESLSKEAVQQKAEQEFDNFIQTLQQKNIDVIVVQDTPQPLKPDAIFPNNWFCTLPDGKIIIFPMYAINRRVERRYDVLQQLHTTHHVNDMLDLSGHESENLFLESTGSMIIDHPNKIIYACLSPRTHKTLLEKFAATHGYRAVTFTANDENGVPVYHTNVIMHIGETYAVICLSSISNETERSNVSRLLTSTGHEIIDISFQQVRSYAGNMLQVQNKQGQKFTILSQQAYNSLNNHQKQALEKHTGLLPVNINTIETIGGGSVRCMMAEIFLQPR